MKYEFDSFSHLLSDFDGVFTDNHVYLNNFGQEFVNCSRSDGFGISMLKFANILKIIDLEIAILSREKNKVVNTRAKKLGIKCFAGINNKYKFLEQIYFPSFGIDIDEGFSKLIYLGNDLNDLKIIERAGMSFVPCDSHPLILKKAIFVSKNKGGNGFVREVAETLVGSKNILKILDLMEEA